MALIVFWCSLTLAVIILGLLLYYEHQISEENFSNSAIIYNRKIHSRVRLLTIILWLSLGGLLVSVIWFMIQDDYWLIERIAIGFMTVLGIISVIVFALRRLEIAENHAKQAEEAHFRSLGIEGQIAQKRAKKKQEEDRLSKEEKS